MWTKNCMLSNNKIFTHNHHKEDWSPLKRFIHIYIIHITYTVKDASFQFYCKRFTRIFHKLTSQTLEKKILCMISTALFSLLRCLKIPMDLIWFCSGRWIQIIYALLSLQFACHKRMYMFEKKTRVFRCYCRSIKTQ